MGQFIQSFWMFEWWDAKSVQIFSLLSYHWLIIVDESCCIFPQMKAIVSALSAENEREYEPSADPAETPRLQENLRKLVIHLELNNSSS